MPTAISRPRRSLTETQLETPAGVELLSLCESITSDGKVTEAEVAELRGWLNRNRDSGLPSGEFLAATVERILQDGRITAEELGELHDALETVLPQDLRKEAQKTRRATQAEERRLARARAAAEAKEQAAEELERNEPIAQYDFMVAGSDHDGRDRIVRELLDQDDVSDVAYLRRDAENPHSRNAVEVRIWDGRVIGYVPEHSYQVRARDVARHLDAGARHDAGIKKILTGGRSPIVVIVADLYNANANIEGAVTQAEVPSHAGQARPAGRAGTIMLGLHGAARTENTDRESAVGPVRSGCAIIMVVLLGIGLAIALVARLLH